MKRVLVAAMHHESNSFNPIVAGENEFRVLRGQEFFENFRDNDSLTGVVKTLMDAGYEVVPPFPAVLSPMERWTTTSTRA